MEEEGSERYVVLTRNLKIKAFEEEVQILLESQPNCCLPLEAFMTSYQSYFGHKCKISDYGYENLEDLMGNVSNVSKVQCCGQNILHFAVNGCHD